MNSPESLNEASLAISASVRNLSDKIQRKSSLSSTAAADNKHHQTFAFCIATRMMDIPQVLAAMALPSPPLVHVFPSPPPPPP